MGRIRCFLLTPTDEIRYALRRYVFNADAPKEHGCPLPGRSYHDASVLIHKEPAIYDERHHIVNELRPPIPHDDPRWPTACACGYEFRETDHWQISVHQIYLRADTGEEALLFNVEPGAMWEQPWLDDLFVPQGAHNLVVKTPGGEWCVDGPANNCTMKEDHGQKQHHCWVRHGTPPDITVDKNGATCAAGAGSIQAGSYHGFLRNGWLED